MATATQVMPHMGGFESGCNVNDDRKDDMVSIAERSVETDNPSQLNSAKPPKPGMRHCTSSINLANALDVSSTSKIPAPPSDKSHFLPVFHSGSYCEQGPKRSMEDKHLCIDNILQYLNSTENVPLPGAFYGVFDGHNGTDAASFTKKNILKFITEDEHFPSSTKKAVRNAFTKADHVFADASSVDVSSGTTVLIALILGSNMVVANAGDSRAVLSKRGRAIELSKDHKPNCTSERQRIEKMGGMVYDGYLNGQLSVARALGDWHLKGPKGSVSPLSCEPELQEILLTEEDEFLILGCDGLWDVMSSQWAVTMVRNGLMQHNDSTKCCKELVAEALRRNTCDNLTVVVVCFSPDPPPKIEIPRSNRRRSISDEGIHVLKGLMDS